MDLFERIGMAVRELGADSKLLDVADRIINDMRPSLEDAYLFANTSDNEKSLFEAAQYIQKEELAGRFLVIDGADANGFPGYEAWSTRLGEYVGLANVQPVKIDDPYQINTLSESQALAARVRETGLRHLFIVAANFHQLRAMMTAASEEIRHERQGNEPYNLFNFVGEELPWEETVAHSQGTLVATRAELVGHELERIQRYQVKGDIMPAEDILAYMERRTLPRLEQQHL